MKPFKIRRSLLSLTISALLLTPSVNASDKMLSGFRSDQTIPDSLFEEPATEKSWMQRPAVSKSPPRPATPQNLQLEKKLQQLERELAEQQRINAQMLVSQTDHQQDNARLQAALEQQLQELQSRTGQQTSAEQQVAALRLELKTHQLLTDSQQDQRLALTTQLEQQKVQAAALQASLTTAQEKLAQQQQAQAVVLKPESHEQKLAYANGVAFANHIVQSLRAQQNLGVTPDRPMVLAGIRDAFEQKIALNGEEVTALVSELDGVLNSKLQTQQQQREQRVAEGKAFIEKTKSRKGVKNQQGAFYLVSKVGRGEMLRADSTVDILLTGRLPDGSLFDSSGKENKVQRLRVDSLLPALTAVLMQVNAGSELEVVLPPELAFGEQGIAGVIPGGATLIFDIKVSQAG